VSIEAGRGNTSLQRCARAVACFKAIAAKELKISKETVRNRLKSVFLKTDTHRQSELVALLQQLK
jgi:DNA-binding NarL/FixJ family response regulator